MANDLLTGPARRVALASVVVIALLVAASAVTIWRYEHAIGQKDSALGARADQLATARAVTIFWRERESMNEYLIQPTAEIASEVGAERAEFDAVTANLGTDVPAERRL